ncbi:unnamed protein product [Clonostachys rosea f. rosea IK726]|uniref:Uncharacterized protein n=3 Tax=Clonostachys TaxID=110564 RepID=A0A0B7KBM0_BIOOC|nr:unnamed protein product [Clonostachys rosea f. rosea IK726]CAG9984348.1 unnamed protein product [Clonostachys byssicola]
MAPTIENQPMELPKAPEQVQVAQPKMNMAMDPERPHAESELSLRGGREGEGMCPGRFCFCIPCPIPCNCCIIPIPCPC